jgi:small GTP-binding protein
MMGSAPNSKIIFIGEPSVGKTSIIQQYHLHTFDEEADSTIGASFIAKSLETSQGTIQIHIWDTAGQERYRSLIPMYSRNAVAAVIVVDVTQPSSFETINVWVEIVKSNCTADCRIYIVANKMDLPPVIQVSDLERWCTTQSFPLFKTSAKRHETIEPLFLRIGQDIIHDGLGKSGDFVPRVLTDEPSQGRPCC